MGFKHTIVAICAFLLPLGGMLAQQFEASANKTKLGKNEEVKISFSFEGQFADFKPPQNFNTDFQILEGPSHYNATSIINGVVKVETTVSYLARPRRTGKIILQPAKMTYNGRDYSSNELEFFVSEKTEKPTDPNDPHQKAEKLAYLKSLVNKRKVYVGQPIVGRHTLFLQTRVGRFENIEEPDFSGFLKERIPMKSYDEKAEVIDGQRYTTVDVERFVLIPQEPGVKKPGILSMRLPTHVPTNQRDWFGRQLSTTINQVAEARFPEIEVLPLPTAGRPPFFGGAVGQYSLTASLSRNEVEANESVTLTVKLSGRGNVKLVEVNPPVLPPALEQFEPKYNESVSVNLSGMSGSKTYEYVLVPRYRGTYKIPEIQFAYFDPEKKDYVTLRTESFEINVLSGDAPPPGQLSAGGANRPVDMLSSDILFIKLGEQDWTKDTLLLIHKPWFKWVFGVIFAILGAMFIIAFAQRKKRRKITQSSTTLKKIRESMKKAEKAGTSNSEAMSQHLLAALYLAVSLKAELPVAELKGQRTGEVLLGKVEGDLSQLEMLIEELEMARYAPVARSNMHDWIPRTKQWTKTLTA